MKKIILCASLFALALAGCTKEAVNEGEGEIGKGKSISFLGTIEGSDATRVEIGEYTDGAQSVSLLWTPDDKIVVGAYDAEGNLLQGVKEGWNGEPTYYELFDEFLAKTESPSTTTDFVYDGFNGFTLQEGVTDAHIYAFTRNTPPYGNTYSTDFKAITDPVTHDQQYNVLYNTASDIMFLTAHNTCTSEDATVELQFSNAFATLMLGLKGSAKIDSVIVKAAGHTLTYPAGAVTANVFERPEPGTKAADLLVSQGGKFINDVNAENATVTGAEDVCVVLSNPLALTPEIQWIPVMVMPFTAAGTTLEITAYGTPDNAVAAEGEDQPAALEAKSVTRTLTIPAGTADITTNSIAYITVKDISAEELGQTAPTSDWKAGDIILEDDFAWITESWDKEKYDIYGWTSPYHNPMYTKDNDYDVSAALAEKGYITAGAGLTGYYSYDGMLKIGSDDYGVNANLIIPMTPLYTYEGDVVITFRAASYYSPFGTPTSSYSELSDIIPVAAKVKSTVVKEYELARTVDPFTWYEYTLLVEDATADMTIVFGGDVNDYYNPLDIFYIDDIKITIADGETENTEGTKVDRPAAALQFFSPELNDDGKATLEVPAVKELDDGNGNINEEELERFSFAVNGPWELVLSENSEWLQVSAPQWSTYEDPRENKMEDAYGNEMTSICTLQVMEDNDTGNARTATIQLKSGDNVLATYEITQPAAGTKKDIYNINFGTPTEDNTVVTQTMTADVWGIGEYAQEWLDIAFNAEGNNPGLAISNSGGKTQEYEGASKEGNLYFLESVPATGLTEGLLDPSFAINIPESEISEASFLYLEFGAWQRSSNKGKVVAEVIFNNSEETTTIQPSLSAGKWKYSESRIEVPTGATSCTVKFYAQDVDNYGRLQDASSNFKIDDITIAVRSK